MNISSKRVSLVASSMIMLLVGAQSIAKAQTAVEADDTSDAESILMDQVDEQDELDDVRPGRPRPPRLSINSSAKASAKVKINKDVAFEAFVRLGQGSLQDPVAPSSSNLGGGFALAWKLGKFAFSTSIDGTNNYANFMGDYKSNGYVLRQGIANSIKLGKDVNITPAMGISYAFASNTSQNRFKIDASAPIGWRFGNVEWQAVIPKVSYQTYVNQYRSDWTFYVGSGVRWEIAPAATLSATIGFEQKTSTLAKAEYSRWILAPQIAFKIPL